MKTNTILYEGIEIEFQLERKQVKNINLRITEAAEVIVSAPKRVPYKTIEDFVLKKAKSIVYYLAEIEKYRQSLPEPEIFDGKKVYYLGTPCTLTITQGTKNKILRQRQSINMTTTTPHDIEAMREQYLLWLKKEASEKFPKLLDKVYPLVAPYGIPKPTMTIQNMKSLWGSCTISRQTMRLNLQLMKAPESCIEQVILHELVHFRHPDHGKEFYALLAHLMPNYKERQEELNTKYKDGI